MHTQHAHMHKHTNIQTHTHIMHNTQYTNLAPKLVAGECQNPEAMGDRKAVVQLYHLLVVAWGQASLAGHVDNQCHMTPTVGNILN